MADSRELDLVLKIKDQFSKGLTKANSKVDKMSKSLMSFKTLIAGAFGYAAIRQLQNFTMAFAEQEKAEFQLAQAMKNRGVQVDIMLPQMKEYAASLQEQTIYGDELILSNQKLLVSLAGCGAATEEQQAVVRGYLQAAAANDVDTAHGYWASGTYSSSGPHTKEMTANLLSWRIAYEGYKDIDISGFAHRS